MPKTSTVFISTTFQKRKFAIMAHYLSFPKNVLSHLNTEVMSETIHIGPNVADYFIAFSKKLDHIFNEQKRANDCGQPFPKMDPGAVDRRAFTMVMFDIFNVEATRTGSTGIQEFSDLVPKLLLPVPSIYDSFHREGKQIQNVFDFDFDFFIVHL